ncbi:hypothetical protein Hamer_G024580, partial [Homarus americanus]
MVCEPEITRIAQEFETQSIAETHHTVHHEQSAATRAKFTKHVVNSLTEPVKEFDLLFLRRQHPCKTSLEQMHDLTVLKSECSLFLRLFISCQRIDSYLEIYLFFVYENHPFPPPLSNNGDLCTGTIFSLLGSLVSHLVIAVPRYFAYMQTQIQNCQRVDIIWDEYVPNSLKESYRMSRRTDLRTRVEDHCAIPGNWQTFLRVYDKEEICLDSLQSRYWHFTRMSRCSAYWSEESLTTLKRYTALLYVQTSPVKSVNDARKLLLTQKGRQIENIPPPKVAESTHTTHNVPRCIHLGIDSRSPCISSAPSRLRMD